jgi:hypothetical protein
MWKDIAERGRPQKIIWRMRTVCCMPKATNTHTGCVTLIDFLLPKWLNERPAMLRYKYTACLVMFFFFFWKEKLSKSRFPCQISSTKYRGADKSLARPGRKKRYSDRRFWFAYILFIIIPGEILVLFIYIYIEYIYIYIHIHTHTQGVPGGM